MELFFPPTKETIALLSPHLREHVQNAFSRKRRSEKLKLIPNLVKGLSESDNEVDRRICARALGVINHPDAVPALIEALGDKDYSTTAHAKTALENMKSPRAEKHFIKALEKKNRSGIMTVLDKLGELGGQNAVKPLASLLTDREFKTDFLAASALKKIGDRLSKKSRRLNKNTRNFVAVCSSINPRQYPKSFSRAFGELTDGTIAHLKEPSLRAYFRQLKNTEKNQKAG